MTNIQSKLAGPGVPVAAVERGRQVLVEQGQKFEVSDHDFCKFSMTPSVSFKVNIPEGMSGNFYSGTVIVRLKDNVFEPSSSLRHLVEFDTISPRVNPVECHYHDGGPDHNIRHMRNKLANISYFLHRNLDMLCSIQTPPYHSWKNPCERCMSLLNLGLQGVGSYYEARNRNVRKSFKKCKQPWHNPKIESKVSRNRPRDRRILETYERSDGYFCSARNVFVGDLQSKEIEHGGKGRRHVIDRYYVL